jgi:hypothetical protein
MFDIPTTKSEDLLLYHPLQGDIEQRHPSFPNLIDWGGRVAILMKNRFTYSLAIV